MLAEKKAERMQRIGCEIKQLRDNAGLTQFELSNLLNISRSQIANYETGKSIPSIDALFDICLALKVTSKDVLGF